MIFSHIRANDDWKIALLVCLFFSIESFHLLLLHPSDKISLVEYDSTANLNEWDMTVVDIIVDRTTG